MRLALAIWLLCQSAGATSYFVDFVSGNDTANGTSMSTPWQHYPKDANATSVAHAATLIPGDQITFKGGITYIPSSSSRPFLAAPQPNPSPFKARRVGARAAPSLTAVPAT